MKLTVASLVPGENYRMDLPLRKQKGWDEHAKFMDDLAESGSIVLGGPIGDSWVRMLVFSMENESEVHSVMSNDPWIVDSMLRIARIEKWNILLDRLSSADITRRAGHECFLVKRKFGKNWNYDLPIRQQKGWTDHAAFMDSLVDDGTIILGGPIEEGPYVQVAACSGSIREITDTLSEDPWIQSGLIENISVQYWDILLGSLKKP